MMNNNTSKDLLKLVIPTATIGSILLCIIGPLYFPFQQVFILLAVYCFFLLLSIGHALKFRNTAYHIVNTIRQHAIPESKSLMTTDHSYCHVFVIPNYKEPISILKKTLQRLASHHLAQENYVIVLAMEETEIGHAEKGEILSKEFSHLFKLFLVTAHPANLPGEARGKGSNVNFAVRKASAILIKDHAMKMKDLVLTISDADAAIPELYIQQVEYNMKIAKDPFSTVFCPPIFFSRNSNKVPAAVRVTDIMWSVMVMQNLSNSRGILFPCSNYSLSMVLADKVNYWDTDFDAIGEDMHMMLKCFFKTGGHARAMPIYVPINLTNVQSDSYWSTVYARYVQASRHFYGVADVAYSLDLTFRYLLRSSSITTTAVIDRLQLLFHIMEAHLIPVVTSWMLLLGLLMFQLINPHVFDHHEPFQNLMNLLKIISGLSSITLVSNLMAYETLHSIVDRELFYPQVYNPSLSSLPGIVDDEEVPVIPMTSASIRVTRSSSLKSLSKLRHSMTPTESASSATTLSSSSSSSTLLGVSGSDEEETEESKPYAYKPQSEDMHFSHYHPSKRTIGHIFDYAWLPFGAFFYMTLPSTISSVKKMIPNREEKYIVSEKMVGDE